MSKCFCCGEETLNNSVICPECNKMINNKKATSYNQTNTTNQRTSYYDGEIHKCPNCGERLDSFVSFCPACGYELRGAKITSRVNELSLKLEKTLVTKLRVEMIRNFYIPNTKEDICEFMILAITNMNGCGEDAEAWYTKSEQAYQKAKLSFGDAQEFQYFYKIYHKARKRYKTKSVLKSIAKVLGTIMKSIGKFIQSFVKFLIKSRGFQCFLLCLIGVFLILFGLYKGKNSEDSDSFYYYFVYIGLGSVFVALFYAMAACTDDNNKKHK